MESTSTGEYRGTKRAKSEQRDNNRQNEKQQDDKHTHQIVEVPRQAPEEDIDGDSLGRSTLQGLGSEPSDPEPLESSVLSTTGARFFDCNELPKFLEEDLL